ncbi:hypothetical protein [Ekhidna lutea]|nr:hypothetical protein [Ekhidna lutea]
MAQLSLAQSMDSVKKNIKVNLVLSTGEIKTGAYHSHSIDSLIVLEPFSEVRKALRNRSQSALFRQYAFNDLKETKISKKSVGAGMLNGALIIGSIGAIIGAVTNSNDGYILSGPEVGALLGATISVPLGALIGGSTKSGFKPIYKYNSKNGQWSQKNYLELNSEIKELQKQIGRRLFGIAGAGYSSETIHLGVRYLVDDVNSINIHGSFILAAAKGFGLDYRKSFGKPINSRKPYFILAGASYKWNTDRIDNTFYLSTSIGKDFYFTKNTGLSVDIGYDYSIKNAKSSNLKSYLGPRFHFFF